MGQQPHEEDQQHEGKQQTHEGHPDDVPEGEIDAVEIQLLKDELVQKKAELQDVKTRMRELGYEPDGGTKGKGNNQRRGGANEKAWRIIELAQAGDVDALMAHCLGAEGEAFVHEYETKKAKWQQVNGKGRKG